ncbi:MAG: HD domain-containing protein [Desulfobacterales bacterium]|nr:HD domain-containing protein [Desulfobacterales bacterium]
MKNIFVNELKSGEAVNDNFVLAEKQLSQKKDGGNYMTIVLSDKSGSVKGVLWDNIDDFIETPASGDFVNIRGSVSEYRGAPQVVVKYMAPLAPDDIDITDFLPATRRDPESMLSRLKDVSNSVKNRDLNALLQLFWSDASFVEKFKIAPAAKKMHHAYLGGLLEHTLSLALLAERIADHYSGIDRDLLLTGAILHDIGKIKEFVYDRRIDYSDEGRLINHIVIGVEMLQEKIDAIDAFPEKTAMLLKHMIVSHHGNREYGSPEPPKTLEAVMLNYLDEIDAKMNGIREFMESQTADEDWTGYHKPLERFFYKGKTAGRSE